MDLKIDFREFIELLNGTGVKYVIVGAYAVACHGIPRYTGDIDLLIEPSPENAAKVLDVVRRLGFTSLSILPNDITRPDQIVQLGLLPARIDLLTSIEGVEFDEAYEAREEIEIDGLVLSFLSKEHLVKNKRAVGRPQDVADVARLEGLE